MSCKDKERQEPSWWLIGLMSATGILLVVWTGCSQAEWWLSPGAKIIAAKVQWMALVVAGMTVASCPLAFNATSESKKVAPFFATGVAGLLATLSALPRGVQEEIRFILLALIPLLVVVVGLAVQPSMPTVKKEWRPLSLVALGLVAYVGSIIAATGSLGSTLVESVGLTFAVIGIGTVGILGLAVACGIYIGLLGKLLEVAHLVRSLVLKVKRGSG